MKPLTKILAIAIITLFLTSIPMVLAENHKPQLVKIVLDLKVDTGDAKPPGTPGGGGGGNTGGGKGPSGYSLTGVSWKNTPVSIVIDRVSAQQNALFFSAVYDSVDEWDSHTSTNLANSVTFSDVPLFPDTNAPDYINEVMFGDLGATNIIAQTTYWYIRQTGAIVDFDIVFNTYFTWGDATQNSAVMDIQNIATHELGHGFGLADLYQSKFSAQTMYGYASEGQTNKRTLDSGDIAGIQVLYG